MAEEGVQLAIGIDLGRTYSYVGIWQHRHHRVEILPNTQGNRSTPSYVAFMDMELLIGDDAMNQAISTPANTIYDMERLIGRRFSDASVQEDMKLWPFKVIRGTNDVPIIVVSHAGKEKKFSAVEISSMLLKYLKGVAESYIHRTIEDAVITVPTYFDYFQRKVIKNAGQIAGLNVLQTISEPIAAATAYELHKRTNRSHETLVLIFDFGRTSFDVSLIILDENGKLEVKAVGGHDRRLGGQNIDNVMVNHFVKIFNKKYKTDIRCNLRALGRLRNFCVKAKESLSLTTETTIEIDSLHQGIDFSMRITREEFEDLNTYLFCKCIEYVKTCLRDARINKEDVDEVVLVGGSTKIPKVQQLLREFFNGKDLCNQIHPSEVNAYGAAIIAENLSREKRPKFENSVLLDIIPLSLGVDAYDGTFSVIVPRNTPIPAKKERIYFTTRDDQRSIYFKVYMGERSKAEDNILLGKFNIAVPLAPRGKSNVKVVFNIDADGVLNCWVKELTTSLKKKITIDNKKQWISKDEIEMMLKHAEKYKVEDKEYKKKVFARNSLEEYIYNVKRKVKTIGHTNKTFLHKEYITKMENVIEDASRYLDQNELAHVDEYQNTLNHLEKLCVSIFTRIL